MLRRNPASRRLTLRHDPATGAVSVSAPPHLAEATVLAFVARHLDWIRARQAQTPERIPFLPGAAVPLLGRDRVIRHDPLAPRRVSVAEDALLVGGPGEHVAARVEAALRRLARETLAVRARRLAARIGRDVAAVSVRDTRSRWGSCGSGGRLSFSWRLVMAPEPVLDYVVAHEVAHLVEMNHGPRFWALVDTLHPDPAAARAWLRRHGATLHRYG